MIKKFNLDGATRQLQAYPATTWHISAHDFMVSSRAAPYVRVGFLVAPTSNNFIFGLILIDISSFFSYKDNLLFKNPYK